MTEQQPSFAAVCADEGWTEAPSPRKRPSPFFLGLNPRVQGEIDAYFAALIDQGVVGRGSARSYRKALTCAVKQAQRFLGHRLASLRDLYVVEVIAAVAGDDVTLDGADQLSRYSLRQRRVSMRAYLRYVGLDGIRFEDAEGILDEGLRRAARRMPTRYTIDAGRPEGTHRCPAIEEVEKVIAVAGAARTSFVGPRNAAIFALGMHTGMRAAEMMAMRGSDFSERRGQLFLLRKQKGRSGRVEIEVPDAVIPYLVRYIARFDGYAAEQGWRSRIGFGVDGAFWRGCQGRPLTYDGLGAMVRTYTRVSGVEPFVAHSLRHLRASVLGDVLPTEEAALAGGWRTPRVYLRNYAAPLRLIEPESPRPHPPDEDEQFGNMWNDSDGGNSGYSGKTVPRGRQADQSASGLP